jgi:hypothetical protein
VWRDILLFSGFNSSADLETTISKSLDGETFESFDTSFQSGFHDIEKLYSNKTGFIYVDTYNSIWTSTDGENWEEEAPFAYGRHGYAAYGNNRVVSAESGKIYVYDFTKQQVLESEISGSDRGEIAFSNGRFFYFFQLEIWSSIDGLTWTKIGTAPESFHYHGSSPREAPLHYDGQKVWLYLAPLSLFVLNYPTDRLADWKTLHDAAHLANDSDLDGDGLTLLEEFAGDSNPWVADRGAVPGGGEAGVVELEVDVPDAGTATTAAEPNSAAATENATEQYLTLTFHRRLDDPKLNYEVRESTDLSDPNAWQPGGVQVGHALSLGEQLEQVTYRATTPLSAQEKSYLRVKVWREL